jgi:hypothetical protein
MKKCVIIVDDGRIEDVLTSSKEPMEFVVVDFDKKNLDQSVLAELRAPHDFGNVAALADIYNWDAVYDPKRVKEVFAEKRT